MVYDQLWIRAHETQPARDYSRGATVLEWRELEKHRQIATVAWSSSEPQNRVHVDREIHGSNGEVSGKDSASTKRYLASG